MSPTNPTNDVISGTLTYSPCLRLVYTGPWLHLFTFSVGIMQRQYNTYSSEVLYVQCCPAGCGGEKLWLMILGIEQSNNSPLRVSL